ncbi:MAG: hypothetical protein JNL42_20935 [Anaerolineae bacterium]|nr:hypothetical protein [Anaerolineae bacterium]
MRNEPDGGLLLVGMLIGFIVGAAAMLFFSPVDAQVLRRMTEREIAQFRNQTDRVNSSLIDGKAAVQDRLTTHNAPARRS